MARDNAELSNQIAERGGRITTLAVQDQLNKWKTDHLQKFVQMMGSQDKAEKVFVICLNTISRNPKLLECSPASIQGCIMQCFQLNLFPGAFQECAFVPFAGEATFMVQYQGLVKLMLNAGNKSVIARCVFENDYFEYREGESPPTYAPAVVMGKTRGKLLFTYAAVCTAHGHWQVEVLDLQQLANTKKRSKGAKMSDSPWNAKDEKIDDYYTMCSKTALKRVSKWCTKSSELVQAVEVDNFADGEPQYAKASIIDLTSTPEGNKTPLAEPERPQQQALEAPAGGIEVNLGQRETATVR